MFYEKIIKRLQQRIAHFVRSFATQNVSKLH